jgi:hypothetical protein
MRCFLFVVMVRLWFWFARLVTSAFVFVRVVPRVVSDVSMTGVGVRVFVRVAWVGVEV